MDKLNKHFVIATKRLCCNHKNTCVPLAKEWAKALIILQAKPEIASSKWRERNPKFTVNYMGKETIHFETWLTFQQMKKAHNEAELCECVNDLILRSNDGVTAENQDERHLV